MYRVWRTLPMPFVAAPLNCEAFVTHRSMATSYARMLVAGGSDGAWLNRPPRTYTVECWEASVTASAAAQ